jgi:hypothetical protein
MSHQKYTRMIVTDGTGHIDPHQTTEIVQLYNPNGNGAAVVTKQAAQADSTATDVAGLKTDFNALLAKLRAANIIA